MSSTAGVDILLEFPAGLASDARRVSNRDAALDTMKTFYLAHYVRPNTYHHSIASFLFDKMIMWQRSGGSGSGPDAVTREELLLLAAKSSRKEDEADYTAEEIEARRSEAISKTLSRMGDCLRFFGWSRFVIQRKRKLTTSDPNPLYSTFQIEGTAYSVRIKGPTHSRRGGRGEIRLIPEFQPLTTSQPTLAPSEEGLDLADTLERHERVLEFGSVRQQLMTHLNTLSTAATPAAYRFALSESVYLVWPTIRFDAPFAAEILAKQNLPLELDTILKTICAISLNRSINAQEVERFLYATGNIRSSLGDPAATDLLDSRFLRDLLYDHNNTAHAGCVSQFLKVRLQAADAFWLTFLCDIYLRSVCGYVSLRSPLSDIVRTGADKHGEFFPARPLTRLREFIDDSQRVASESIEDAQAALQDIASKAETEIDAKWCLQAALRVLPLYDIDIDQLEDGPFLQQLCEALPERVQRTRHVRYVALRLLLHEFLRKRALSSLRRYEDLFVESRAFLYQPQIIDLQFEYASALRLALDFHEGDLSSLLIAEQASIRNGELVHSALFRNDLPVPPTLAWAGRSVPRDLAHWLEDYVRHVFIVDIKPRVAHNPLYIRHYRAAYAVRHFQSWIRPTLIAALRAAVEDPGCPPSFLAHALVLFRFLSAGVIRSMRRNAR